MNGVTLGAMIEMFTELAVRGAFIAEVLLLVVVGKMLRDLLLLARGYKPAELLAVRDNHAAAIDLAGFILAIVTGLLGALVVRHDGLAGQASDIAMTGIVVIACLVFNDWVTDKLLLRGIDDHEQICVKGNKALAVARAGSAIATGMVVRGAVGNGDPIIDCLVWVAVGQVALLAIAWLYQRLTPYDDLAELERGNLAAAFPMAGLLIAVGLTVEAAVHGETHDLLHDLGSLGMFLGLSVLLLYVLRLFTEWFLLSRARLADEITADQNIGAGLLEGVAFVVGAEILSFFFT